ncbi:DUF7386 family protein [Halorubrum sp. DTA98]|uniref:DUF7386 family protein n=1 Tax=Halorubrum sp. DTA98 TaxID=3402163 RepID=UPI003AAA84B2
MTSEGKPSCLRLLVHHVCQQGFQQGQSKENLNYVRDEYPAMTVKDCCNTSVLGLRYRTSIESKWR